MPRPPKDLEQHKLEGTYRADRHEKKQVPKKKKSQLEFDPFHAGETTLTRKQLYLKLTRHLYRMNMTQAADQHLLMQWVMLYEIQGAILRKVNEEGWECNFGKKAATAAYLEVSKDIRILLAEYYLTPNTRIKAPEVEEEEDEQDEEDLVAKFVLKAVND